MCVCTSHRPIICFQYCCNKIVGSSHKAVNIILHSCLNPTPPPPHSSVFSNLSSKLPRSSLIFTKSLCWAPVASAGCQPTRLFVFLKRFSQPPFSVTWGYRVCSPSPKSACVPSRLQLLAVVSPGATDPTPAASHVCPHGSQLASTQQGVKQGRTGERRTSLASSLERVAL